jgi:type I site-specific restriction endonuclease
VRPDCRGLGDSRRGMDKRGLSERDICTKFILPAIKRAGWDEMLQVREAPIIQMFRSSTPFI